MEYPGEWLGMKFGTPSACGPPCFPSHTSHLRSMMRVIAYPDAALPLLGIRSNMHGVHGLPCCHPCDPPATVVDIFQIQYHHRLLSLQSSYQPRLSNTSPLAGRYAYSSWYCLRLTADILRRLDSILWPRSRIAPAWESSQDPCS